MGMWLRVELSSGLIGDGLFGLRTILSFFLFMSKMPDLLSDLSEHNCVIPPWVLYLNYRKSSVPLIRTDSFLELWTLLPATFPSTTDLLTWFNLLSFVDIPTDGFDNSKVLSNTFLLLDVADRGTWKFFWFSCYSISFSTNPSSFFSWFTGDLISGSSVSCLYGAIILSRSFSIACSLGRIFVGYFVGDLVGVFPAVLTGLLSCTASWSYSSS